VLPDDGDMRCAIETCRSSESVLMCTILDYYMIYNQCICWCAILSETVGSSDRFVHIPAINIWGTSSPVHSSTDFKGTVFGDMTPCSLAICYQC
jgi:hypothetical protein